MADKVVLFEIDINTDKLVTEIADSKKAIAGLQDTIKELSKEEDKNQTAIIQATAAMKAQQQELRTNETLAKNLIIANSSNGDTLQALKAKLSIVSAEWNKLTQDEIENSVEGKKLNQQKLELTETLKKVEKATGDHRREVGNYAIGVQGLKQELKDLKGILLTSKEGTDEYNAALKRSAQIMDDMGDMQARIKGTALDFDGVTQNVTKTLGGVASGYEVVTGLQMLLGEENEDLAKSLLKVQSAMAVANGLEGMGGLAKNAANLWTQLKQTVIVQKLVTTAQWLWNAAMMANPIGAVVAAIAALGAAIYGLVKYFNSSAEAAKKEATALDGLVLSSKEAADAHNEHIKVMKELELEYDLLTGKITESQKAIMIINQDYNKSVEDLNKRTKEKLEETGWFWQSFYKGVALAREDERIKDIKSQQDALSEWNDLREQRLAKERLVREKERQETEKTAKKLNEDLAKIQQENYKNAIEARKKYNEDLEKAFQEQLKKDIATIRQAEQIKRDEAILAAEALQVELDELARSQAFDEEIAAMKATARQIESDANFEAAKNDVFRTLDLQRAALDEKFKMEVDNAVKVGANTTAIAESYSNARKEIDRIEQDTKLSIAENIAGQLSDLVGKETALGKAAAVAATTINTYRGAQAAFAETPGGIVIKSIAAALAVATGLLNVRKILQVKTPGNGGGGGGGSMPSNSTTSVPRQVSQAPNVGQGIVSRNNQVNQNNAIQLQPTLVIDDVTNNQNRKAANTNTSVI